MNKKGIGPIGAIFLFLLFIVMWFVWLGGFINTIVETAVGDAHLTGVEAFLLMNFNFILFLIIIMAMLWFMARGSG